MKKWLKICAAALAFVGVVFYASGSQAFFLKRLLQGPTVLPMPDFPEEAATVGKGVQETVLTAKKLQTATQNTINNTRAALNSVFNFDFKGADVIALIFAFMVLYSGVVAMLTDK